MVSLYASDTFDFGWFGDQILSNLARLAASLEPDIVLIKLVALASQSVQWKTLWFGLTSSNDAHGGQKTN